MALADLGDRRGEKGILEPRISLLQFLHDGHRLVNRHHRYRLIPGIVLLVVGDLRGLRVRLVLLGRLLRLFALLLDGIRAKRSV